MTIIPPTTSIKFVYNHTTGLLTGHFQATSGIPACPIDVTSLTLVPSLQTGNKRQRSDIDYSPIAVGPSNEHWSCPDEWLIRTIAVSKNMTDVLAALSHAYNTSYLVLYSFFDCGIPPKTADISMHFASVLNDKRCNARITTIEISDIINEEGHNVDNNDDNIDIIALEEELNDKNDSEDVIEDL
jgi:hypothetical protein